MASRYWVGGTATWDGTAGTKWATTSGGAGGAAVPTAIDDVFFDAASGAVTVSVSDASVALSLNCTGFTGTLSFSGTVTVSGSVTLVAGMTISGTFNWVINGTGTFTSGGKTLSSLEIFGSGITVTLGSALLLSGQLNLTQGTLTTSASNYSMSFLRFSSAGSLTRTLTLNASSVTVTGNGWTNSANNETLNRGTSTITFTGTAINPSFAGSGLLFYNVTFSATSGSYRINISGANTFNNLTLPATTSGSLIETVFFASQTITTLVAAGSGVVGRLRLSGTVNSVATLTVTTYTTKSDVDFFSITAAGASSPWSGTRLGNGGNNTSITFDAAKTVYWNLAGSQNWSATGWAASSGGSPAGTNFPLGQDTAVFDNTGAAGTVTLNMSWTLPTISASARTSAMTLVFTSSLAYYTAWSITLGTGLTLTSTGATINWIGAGSVVLTSAGKTWDAGLVSYKTAGSTLSLGDAFVTSTQLQIFSGTFDAVSYNVTAPTFNLQTSILMGSGLWTATGTGTIWSMVGTVTKGTANILLSDTSTTARTFAGGGQSYNQLTIGGTTGTSTLTVSGNNTFTEIASTKTVAHTLRLTAGSTTTVGAFTVAGSAGNVVTLDTTSAGSAATLSKSSGIVNVNYLSIRDSTATGGATWYAGANSTNVSNNTGWIFANAPSGSGMMMMTFFPV